MFNKSVGTYEPFFSIFASYEKKIKNHTEGGRTISIGIKFIRYDVTDGIIVSIIGFYANDRSHHNE